MGHSQGGILRDVQDGAINQDDAGPALVLRLDIVIPLDVRLGLSGGGLAAAFDGGVGNHAGDPSGYLSEKGQSEKTATSQETHIFSL